MGKIKYDDSTTKKIIELYEQGLSQRQIAKEIGCSCRLVFTRLKANDIEQRTKADYAKKFDNNTEEKIIQEYKEGATIRELAQRYNCSTTPIVTVFERRGLKFREPSEAISRYKIDISYFDDIDTQDKAYILGLFYADGWNTSDETHGHNVVGITLHEKDIDIIEKIREVMHSDYPIKDFANQRGNNYKQWYFCNKHMTRRLEELGVVRKKAKVTTFPEWLRDDLIPHFIRGLFDGDGSICSSLEYVTIAGTEAIIEYIRSYIMDRFGIESRIYRSQTSPTTYSMFISRKEPKLKFLNWMYLDANLKLKRKYELYKKMCQKYNLDVC